MNKTNVASGSIEEHGMHKAEPVDPKAEAFAHCAHCNQPVRRVPGGQGPTWVHADSGAVVGRNGTPTPKP